MDATLHCTEFSCPQRSPHSRRLVAEKLDQFAKLDSPWTSRRQIARQIDVSDRTLYRWIDRNEHKRRQAPPGVRITPRAFGKDRRYPITNRWSWGT